MANRTKASNLSDCKNDLAEEILTALTEFTRKININSSKLYDCSSEIINFMNEYQKIIETWINEFEIEYFAVSELKKQLSRKMKAYFEQQ